MKIDLIQRGLRVFLNFQHFPVKQRNWGIKEDWVKHHLEIFIMLLYFTGFRYCCLSNSESSRNPVKYILAPVLKWSFGSWQIKRNSKPLFSSNTFYVAAEYIARKKFMYFLDLFLMYPPAVGTSYFVVQDSLKYWEGTAGDYIHVPSENIKHWCIKDSETNTVPQRKPTINIHLYLRVCM